MSEHTTGEMPVSQRPQQSRRPYFVWEPETDITVYELALCLPLFVGHGLDIDGLPDEARRHFTLKVGSQ